MPFDRVEVTALLKKMNAKIENGEVAMALELGFRSEHFPDPENRLKGLFVQWKTAERDMLQGDISRDDFSLTRNRLSKALIKLVSDIEEKLAAIESREEKNNSNIAPELPDFGNRIPIVYLYSPEDEEILLELKKHLFLLARDTDLYFLDIERDIPLAVVDITSYQERLVTAAKTVLLVITPNILNEKTYRLLELSLAQGTMIPIYVEEADLSGTALDGKIRGLPSDGRFIDDWDNRNSAWTDVAQSLRTYFERLKSQQSD